MTREQLVAALVDFLNDRGIEVDRAIHDSDTVASLGGDPLDEHDFIALLEECEKMNLELNGDVSVAQLLVAIAKPSRSLI